MSTVYSTFGVDARQFEVLVADVVILKVVPPGPDAVTSVEKTSTCSLLF